MIRHGIPAFRRFARRRSDHASALHTAAAGTDLKIAAASLSDFSVPFVFFKLAGYFDGPGTFPL
jgi:hypothetical protein